MQQLDAQRFAVHFSEFVSLADAGAGLQAYVEALETKHRLFAAALADPARLDLAQLEELLGGVFTARRKLYPAIEALGAEAFPPRVAQLLGGQATRGAFFAELPITADRAGRRSVRGRAPRFAAAWLYERIAEQGIWRDQHWLADLVLAMAYVTYFRAMTGGVLGSDFTRASTPEEQLRKLLGLDAAGGRPRVRKSAATIH